MNLDGSGSVPLWVTSLTNVDKAALVILYLAASEASSLTVSDGVRASMTRGSRRGLGGVWPYDVGDCNGPYGLYNPNKERESK